MKQVAIYGTGGFGREVYAILQELGANASTQFVGWVDDEESKRGTRMKGHPVFTTLEELQSAFPVAQVALAVGNTAARRRLAERLGRSGITPATVVSPRALVGPDVAFGAGCIITQNCVLTTDIQLGDFVVLGASSVVSHDDVLEDFVTIAPSVNLSGAVHVGEGCDVGTGSAVIQGLSLGAWSVVGAGAVVTKNVPPNTTVVGVPARVIKEREAGWHL